MSERHSAQIAVLGAGSWGSALALQLARVGHQIKLWTHMTSHAEHMRATGGNPEYLPDITFPADIAIYDDLAAALSDADHVLIVTPSHAFSETLERAKPQLSSMSGLAWASKGFEPGTGRFLHEVAVQQLGDQVPLALVSGPSFAKEVALGMPTAVTVASNQPAFGALWANLLHGESFRAYYSDDLIGAELGGALKNVIAVACGVADGLNLGLNTRAALITRGLAEMIRLGEALGADQRTLVGLAGVGDLVLTCTGDLSRNRRFGLSLGRGKSVNEALEAIDQVVEGVKTTEEAMRLAKRHGVEMPITEQVWAVIFEGRSPIEAVKTLMQRELKPESV